ncbi:MAG: TIGR01777 family protein [Deltaproteobacteria bacterium]|nr:TIGR01777 family protein [Deltaproteobacteria bacterium]
MAHVLILGATGLIGQALGQALVKRGDQVSIVSRGIRREQLSFPCTVFQWGPDCKELPDCAIDGIDAVVNLAGESIAEGRWTDAKKARLMASRLGPTEAMVQAVTRARRKPRVVVQASAIGYYPDAGDESLTESSAASTQFTGQLCAQWEAATDPLKPLGVRVALLRIGVVLAHGGGALPKLAKLYRLGLGAAPGSGDQWFSWIHLDDMVGLILTALSNDKAEGPINATAPNPCRFVELHRQLTGRASGPVLKAPSAVMKVALGEAAQMVLASTKVIPVKALELGHQFKFPTVASAVDDLLGTDALRDTDWLRSAQWLPAPLTEVAKYFSDERNLEELTPPWLSFNVVGKSTSEIENKTLIYYKLRLHGISFKWTTEIIGWDPPRGFVDQQLRGPFAVWHHTHQFSELGGGTLMVDFVRYKPPVGILGALTGGWMVDHDVARIFGYRRETIARRFPEPAA